MKKIRNILFIALISIINVIFSINVYAEGRYVMSIAGASQVSNGSNITFTLTGADLSGVVGGFDGYQGNIDYDSNMLSFVSAQGSISGWEFKINSDQANKIIFLGYDQDSPNRRKTVNTELFKITFKAKNVGSTQLMFSGLKGGTGSGDPLTASAISKTITIVQAEQTKSSNADLSSLSVSGYQLSPSFKPGTTSYKLSVGNKVTSLDLSAIASDSKARVSISGNNKLSVGKNNILVEVTAEDGNKKTYKIEVTRASATSNTTTTTKSSNNNLSSISGINGLQFSPQKTDYTVEVPFESTGLNVSAIPEDSKSKVNISNGSLSNLEVGKSQTVTITVTAEDSSIKIYTIKVTRSSYKSETGLKELKVNDQELLDGSSDKDTFKLTVPSDTKTLDISALPISSGSTVKIKGDTTLKDGNNTVIVEVTDKNGFTKSYTIDVERKSNFLLDFFKNWWILLLVMLFILLILLLLLHLYNKNKRLLAEIEEEEEEVVYKNQIETVPHIDIRDNIVYNNINDNNDAPAAYEYVPKHSEIDNETISGLLSDDSVSEVSKEIKFVKNDDGDVQREYKIIENYRKK